MDIFPLDCLVYYYIKFLKGKAILKNEFYINNYNMNKSFTQSY